MQLVFSRYSTVWLSLALGVWALVLLYGVVVYTLRVCPENVTSYVEHMVAKQLPGYSFRAQSVRPALWPSPGVSFEHIIIRNAEHSLLAKTFEVNVRWRDLLQGSMLPTRLKLKDAAFVLDSALDTSSFTIASLWSAALAMAGMELDVESIDLAIRAPNAPQLFIKNLTGTAHMPSGVTSGVLGISPGNVRMVADSIQLLDKGVQSTLNDVSVTGTTLRFTKDHASFLRTGKGTVQGVAHIDGILRNAQFQASAELATMPGAPNAQGSITLTGDALLTRCIAEHTAPPHNARTPQEEPAVPLAVSVAFNTRDVRQGIEITNFDVSLGNNAAQGKAYCTLSPLQIQGSVDVTRLSLPRWFAFARALPDSLADALDTLSGAFAFKLNKNTFAASDLHFSLRNTVFNGAAVIDNLRKPILRLEAKTRTLDLNSLLPELVGKPSPKAPTFSTPPLFDDIPEDTSNVMGFDIRLWADETDFWKLHGTDFTIRIAPIWSRGSTSNTSGTAHTAGQTFVGASLEARMGNAYGGVLEGFLRVEDLLYIDATLRGADTASLLTAIEGSPLLRGKLNAKAKFNTPGGNLTETLSQLAGTLDATIENGAFVAGQDTFKKYTFVFSGRGQPTQAASLPKTLTYIGDWNTTVQSGLFAGNAFDAVLRLNGSMDFSTQTWLPLSGKAKATLRGTLNKAPVDTIAQKVVFSVPDEHIALQGVSGVMAELTFSGNLTGSTIVHAPIWTGHANISSQKTRALLTRLGFPLDPIPPDRFQHVNLQGDFVASSAQWKATNIQAKVDETNLTAQAVLTHGRVPKLDMTASLDTLDVDTYILSSRNTPASATPWPVQFLHNHALNATINIQKMRFAGLTQEQVTLPVRLDKGVLTAEPLHATLYGGREEGRLHAIAQPDGVDVTVNYNLTNTDMLNVTSALSKENGLTGRGSMSINMHGKLRSSADIPAALNGTWQITVTPGAFATFTPKGKLQSTRPFRMLSTSGTLQNGILRSTDMRVAANTFSARGGGEINFLTRTINYQLTASMPGVPNIPIRYSGPLEDPRRNINALAAISGVLSTLGKSMFSLLDKVISAPFQFLP